MPKNRYVRMDPKDNVVVLVGDLQPGEALRVDGELIQALDAIPTGHKMATRPISRGDYIIKYGERIGRATAPIAAGNHVHTHNVFDITEEVSREERRKLGL